MTSGDVVERKALGLVTGYNSKGKEVKGLGLAVILTSAISSTPLLPFASVEGLEQPEIS